MSQFFRSTSLQQFNLILPRESAYKLIVKLGHSKTIHFEDNIPTVYSRPFAIQLKRCDELLVKLLYLESVLLDSNIHLTNSSNNIQEFLKISQNQIGFDQIESMMNQKKEFLQSQLKTMEELKDQQSYLDEYEMVLRSVESNQVYARNEQEQSFQYLIGLITTEQENQFRKLIFRISRGNAIVNQIGEIQNKRIYQILFTGRVLHGKISRMLQNFMKFKFEIPSQKQHIQSKLQSLNQQIIDSHHLIMLTQSTIKAQLDNLSQLHESGVSYIYYLKQKVEMEKSVYSCLNLMKLQNSILIGRVWIPSSQVGNVQKLLHEIDSNMPGGQLLHINHINKDIPPTLISTNDFTGVFQTIINTYGCPRYKEVNPGIFTIITFPFLFGVMFGDIGHGSLLLIFSFYLICKNNKIGSNSFKDYQYLILLMSWFAFYIGLIYNDFFGLPLKLFGSCYTNEELDENTSIILKKNNCYLKFGIDPIWGASSNHLQFVNSFKMKTAVIIGVAHMLFGIFIKGVNSIYFKNKAEFIFEFIPQLCFLLFTFAYMDSLIIIKWLDPASVTPIIQTMINMFLNPNTIHDPLFEEKLQLKVQQFFLVSSILLIPLMLFAKPLILMKQLKNQKILNFEMELALSSDNNDQANLMEQEYKMLNEDQFIQDLAQENTMALSQQQQCEEEIQFSHQENDIGEIFVHQAIETIEFVLGTISNTASYLRLWALSLAHSQLSEVFFQMTLSSAINEGKVIHIMFGFIVFSAATFGVLMMMDTMECFLHSLRLHWVEFQSKFYKGDGRPFQAFSFTV